MGRSTERPNAAAPAGPSLLARLGGWAVVSLVGGAFVFAVLLNLRVTRRLDEELAKQSVPPAAEASPTAQAVAAEMDQVESDFQTLQQAIEKFGEEESRRRQTLLDKEEAARNRSSSAVAETYRKALDDFGTTLEKSLKRLSSPPKSPPAGENATTDAAQTGGKS